ncbi:uncharacterized protein IL334_007013 [Kwoniella shivajii]|uniref:Uncharacterized protein n=1 Tax=Kwoniella shivajii TaxID=564305 RepID=A0ABZ1D7Z3_9TREE|nr:hypothetical protein IL334_007013 [Kwoniella shivajii]
MVQAPTQNHHQVSSQSRDPYLDFLDGSLIPSLPIAGGRVGHQELMGMGLGMNRPPQPIIVSPPNPQLPYAGLPYTRPPPQQGNNGLPPRISSGGLQPGMVIRSSSEGKKPHPPYISGMRGHMQTHSISNVRTSPDEVENKSERPLLKRSGSFGQLAASDFRKGPTGKYGHGHGRTASESTIIDIPHSLIPCSGHDPHPDKRRTTNLHHSISDSAVRSTPLNTHNPSLSDSEINGIRLGSMKDTPPITYLLDILHSLIPPERSLNSPPPSSDSRILHPLSILTPMSIILEALVIERTILQSQSQDQDQNQEEDCCIIQLPLLINATSFHLEQGELDWSIMRWYILTLGQLLNNLLPFLQEIELKESGLSKQDEEMINDLMKSIRAYVGKMKKVFGEIAGLYVDNYSFIRGFWSEEGMKDGAQEVGRWGDWFDA